MLDGTEREGTGGGGNEGCKGLIMGGCEEEGWEIGEGEDGVGGRDEVEDIGAVARWEAGEMDITEGGNAISGEAEEDDSEGKGEFNG